MKRLAAVTGHPAALALGACVSAAAAFAGSDMAGGALRALAVVILLACAAFAFRRRPSTVAVGAALTIAERHAVAKDVGVALVVVDGRRLVVGYAPAGVALVTELALSGDAERTT